jgi:hypothetical protein
MRSMRWVFKVPNSRTDSLERVSRSYTVPPRAMSTSTSLRVMLGRLCVLCVLSSESESGVTAFYAYYDY